MDARDKRLIEELQFDFPLTEQPYRELACRLKMPEEEVIARIKKLKKEKVIRYIGPLFNMAKLGYESTLLAMCVPQKDLRRVVRMINRIDEVSHNYLRDDQRYNLWFTLTVPQGTLSARIKKIKKMTGISDLLNLKNEGMLKLDTRFRL